MRQTSGRHDPLGRPGAVCLAFAAVLITAALIGRSVWPFPMRSERAFLDRSPPRGACAASRDVAHGVVFVRLLVPTHRLRVVRMRDRGKQAVALVGHRLPGVLPSFRLHQAVDCVVLVLAPTGHRARSAEVERLIRTVRDLDDVPHRVVRQRKVL
jgi:hypothetical protein